MTTSFLHGVETITKNKGSGAVKVVKTAVIGLVGTAPMGSLNTLEWVRNDVDDAAFGEEIDGFTIPQALRAFRDHGAGDVLVINVCDPATHKTAVAAEAHVFADNKITLENFPVLGVPVIKTADDATTYAAGDYTLDAQTGVITRTSASTIPAAGSVKVAYEYLDPSKVLAADVIGGVDGVTGLREGMKLFEAAKSTYGFGIKILVAPAYATQESVVAAMLVLADKVRCFPLIDAPIGTTVNQAIAGRGAAGTINFETSNPRAMLLYPHLKVYDAATDANRLEPYSQRFAGLIAKVHAEEGYWFSPSNHEIKGITGVERAITFALNDPTCEANALNEAGITTVAVGFGTGTRAWGNRTAAWPTDTGPKNFMSLQMISDIAAETVEDAMLPYIDKPITQAVIDEIRDKVNGYYRTCIGRGALIQGSKCEFIAAKNPPDEIAAGHLTFTHTIMGPTPLERLTHEQIVDTSLLAGAFK